MRLYVLHLADEAALSRAMSRILDCSSVASFVIEPRLGRVRFVTAAQYGERLVETIYMQGRLRWCSRHEVPFALRPSGTGYDRRTFMPCE